MISQHDWISYSPDEGPFFSVEVPSEMEIKSNQVDTEIGRLITMAYILEGSESDKNKLYLINSVVYPEGSFPQDSIGLKLDYLSESITSTVINAGGQLIYSQEQKVGGELGYVFRIKYNDGTGIIKGKAVISGDTFFMLKVYSHKDDSLNQDMDYFLNSFRLIQ